LESIEAARRRQGKGVAEILGIPAKLLSG
jgi:hypothetical protein